MGHSIHDPAFAERRPWNTGRTPGAKRALKPQQIWAIRFWLDRERRMRDRALFDLAIDSKLRGCDLVRIRIGDLVSGGRVRDRAIVIQRKTSRPVQFELLEPARGSLLAWLERRGGTLEDFAFPSRADHSDHLSTRQYARLVDEWVSGIGLRREDYGTHSMRRTKASIIYKQLATFAQSRSCLVTRRSRAPSVTLASMSKMRSRWPRPRKSRLHRTASPLPSGRGCYDRFRETKEHARMTAMGGKRTLS
jgi:integrase